MTAQNNTRKTAVLICNTGSPAAPTKEAVAKYLAEFLGDRRVVEMNPLICQPILRGIIIPRRAQASADRYKTVWTQKGSPLVAATSDTAQGLQKVLGDEFIVSWAMCYGVQRIEEELARIAAQKPERIVVLPLYAQYATQTTESVFDAVRRVQKKIRDLPPVVTIPHYFTAFRRSQANAVIPMRASASERPKSFVWHWDWKSAKSSRCFRANSERRSGWSLLPLIRLRNWADRG